jgi:hypothetical protein
MIALASGLRVYLACGVTDMRKGMAGLAMLVQQSLAEDPDGWYNRADHAVLGATGGPARWMRVARTCAASQTETCGLKTC